MKPEILRKYPLVKKHLDYDRSIFGAPEAELRQQQERALELIDADGAGGQEEKEASMISAMLMLNPMSIYMNIGRFWEGYSEEVENTVQAMLSTAPDSFLPLAIAQATAAAGIAQMEMVSDKLAKGKLEASPQDTLDGLKKAYSHELENFAYLDAPALLARFDKTRTDLFAALEAKIAPPAENPALPPKRQKPDNGNFEF